LILGGGSRVGLRRCKAAHRVPPSRLPVTATTPRESDAMRVNRVSKSVVMMVLCASVAAVPLDVEAGWHDQYGTVVYGSNGGPSGGAAGGSSGGSSGGSVGSSSHGSWGSSGGSSGGGRHARRMARRARRHGSSGGSWGSSGGSWGSSGGSSGSHGG